MGSRKRDDLDSVVSCVRFLLNRTISANYYLWVIISGYPASSWNLTIFLFDLDGKPLDLVHNDVCGPMPTSSLGGSIYFVTFIDDATWKFWIYSMKFKDETFSSFKMFLSSIEIQFGRKLKALHSKNGGKYIAREFANLWGQGKIKREFLAPYITT